MNIKTFELTPIDGRVSFYGKATVYECPNGTAQLKSYDTIVCEIDKNGAFSKTWAGWSATTARHINAFRSVYGLPKLTKSEWDKIPYTRGTGFVTLIWNPIKKEA